MNPRRKKRRVVLGTQLTALVPHVSCFEPILPVHAGSLDFDFEKLCCVSLTNLNVYVCLVCGKYFQGIILFKREWKMEANDECGNVMLE